MANKYNSGIWKNLFLTLIVSLVLASFVYASTKLSKDVYVEHQTAQDRALEKIDEKLAAILSREMAELKKVAAKK